MRGRGLISGSECRELDGNVDLGKYPITTEADVALGPESIDVMSACNDKDSVL